MESFDFVRYSIAVIFVLLLAGIAFLVKRYAANPSQFRVGLKTRLGKWEFAAPQRRIVIVESLMIGPRQKLFIVRRDNVEHLVLSGPDGASVLETGIPAPTKTQVLS